MPSRHIVLFMSLICFLWATTLINIAVVQNDVHHQRNKLQEDGVLLADAKNVSNDVSQGTRSITNNSMAMVALERMVLVLLKRIDKLENKLDVVHRNLSEGMKRTVKGNAGLSENTNNNSGLSYHKRDKCMPNADDISKFPYCMNKLKWMASHWTSDPCYAKYGVNGSFCSFRIYQSEVENWCPLLPGRIPPNQTGPMTPVREKASLIFKLDGLMDKLLDPESERYAWMRLRVRRMWSRWTESAQQLSKNQSLQNRSVKRVLVHLGLLTNASGFKIAEMAFEGGPLGELVQWSDLISTLYILGHNLTITSEMKHIRHIFAPSTKKPSCPATEPLLFDLIYTDLVGLKQIKRVLKSGYTQFRCVFKIVDSFGTEPAFNYDHYADSHRMKTLWGMKNLNPKQFYTMFPHSPDNSFLGFAVENHLNDTDVRHNPARGNQALVYGKAQYMWKGKAQYLDTVQQFLEIHGTVSVQNSSSVQNSASVLPAYVHNHGLLPGSQLQTVMRQSKVFLGLGFPYEGPAPLEAIANGAVFINPKFNPPHNSKNTKFFQGKPTLRQVTSQHPYAEDFIGEPHVITVDISNKTEVMNAIQKALKYHEEGRISPYLPYEFSEGGMLERVNAYIEHQDFCSEDPPLWPPEAAVKTVLGHQGKSCKEVCEARGQMCEPSHFKMLNTMGAMAEIVGECTEERSEDIYFPAYKPQTKHCILQSQALLFSCVGAHSDYARVCPCRDFIKGQTALCPQCL